MTVAENTNIFASPFSRLQRNHGLEHATLHMLAESNPHTPLAGHSDLGGFWILGNVETEDLRRAVNEALQRMRQGEHELSVHPNCGTNYVAAGALAGLAAWTGMLGAGRGPREKVERLPVVIGLATLALLVGQPLGLLLQARVTTSGYPGNLEVVDITPSQRGRVRSHRVTTRG
ncbi:MAG TPA: DUF6391 domain-containing protein [Anaerolineaceae bacterium]